MVSSQAWPPPDAETGQEGVHRAGSSISLQHLCLFAWGLQANVLLPGGSLVGLRECLTAKCVEEELLSLLTHHLFPCCLSVNGPLNSKLPEERKGESLVTTALTKQTVPGHSQAQQWDCPHQNLGQLSLTQAISAYSSGVSLGQGQSQQDLSCRLPICRMYFTA